MTHQATYQANEYQYPDDKIMLSEFRRMRSLQGISAQVIRDISEPSISGELTGMGVRVSQRQFPEILALAERLAPRFGVPVPHIFIVNDPYLNAFTHGIDNQSFVAITSALLEQLDTAGLSFILGHEIGHIQCQHVLYTTMAHWLLDPAREKTKQVTPDLLDALLQWLRVAEITADRAGLLACQDPSTAGITLLTLVTGRKSLAARVDIDEYVADQCLALEFNPVALERQHGKSHPYMPFRVGELRAFINSPAYRRLAGKLPEVTREHDEAITINFL